jgi:hypothetical protein
LIAAGASLMRGGKYHYAVTASPGESGGISLSNGTSTQSSEAGRSSAAAGDGVAASKVASTIISTQTGEE